MSPSPETQPESPADLERQLAELANLYEVARALLGARDSARVASRIVLAAMGTLGARSGALFRADERGRFRLAFHYPPESAEPGDTVRVEPAACEWMLHEGAFSLAGPAAARGLGTLQGRLVERYGAAVGAIVADPQGPAALIVLGARLLDEAFTPTDLAMLDSLAGLAALALGSRAEEPAAAARAPRRTAGTLERLRAEHPPLATLVGASPSLLEACQDLVAVAATRFPVLIMGESGVGKELAARAVHEISERAGGPFEVVDCGSIPRELIESELFGHVKGSFTGAHRDRKGAFELAHRGTLFLDEIGEMPLQLQTRLLRVVQEGRFRRVGDEQSIDTDVRIVAATNRDLLAEVAARRFREDLYYRLNVFAVRMPPLRDRLSDLVPLLHRFLPRLPRGGEWKVESAALAALGTYRWPGNVRELANFCTALAVETAGRGTVTLEDLEAVWRRQHGEEPAPWHGAAADRGRLGEWVLEQARAQRFNLIEAARQIQRRKRGGQPAPLSERSALSYYVTGEILRALAESECDTDAAARRVAGDEELLARVTPRVAKVVEALLACRGDAALARRRFAKLPAGYEPALERTMELLALR
ncbi:MAG TPA: sigma-54 dependent transcriptional regulator [Candidatus Eisenbacteria bacterium]